MLKTYFDIAKPNKEIMRFLKTFKILLCNCC